MAITLREQYLEGFVSPHEMDCMAPQVAAAAAQLRQHTGAGSDFHGWLPLPRDYDKEELARIHAAAEKIRSDTDVLVVIGIGGSYLGARSAIELLRSPFYNALGKDGPAIYFAGCNLSGSYLDEILALCEGKRVSLNVISKSCTTTEPALAFRVLRGMMEQRYGKEAAERIYCTTDRARGTLKSLADREGWQTFVIPDDVGGRYSVLTAVGLLPMAVAGIDIDAVLRGAQKAMTELANEDFTANACYRYAAIRNILLRRGKAIEIYASYDHRFTQMGEWLKLLYGESEGKDGKGLFPVSCVFSTDLHSVGQYIQESGSKLMFETVMQFDLPQSDYVIGEEEGNIDGLNFLAGKEMSYVNEKARQGTLLAHTAGGVGNFVLEIDALDAENMGYMIYFFEKVCAVSGYMLGVNPFNQPGVESYKKNMFALLGKPGYESEKENLEKQLGLC